MLPVSLTIAGPNGDFAGQIISPEPHRCAENRTVTVYQQRGAHQHPATDQQIGSDTSELRNGRGQRSIGNSGYKSGRFYARVESKPGCRTAYSRTVRPRRSNCPAGSGARELKRARTFALISRKVCADCNSGWLGELEERVRPLMAAFAANTPIELNADEQADLALWAAVAALIAMSLDPEAAGFADPALAHEIFRERHPPASMDIWLGANSHGEMGWFGSHSSSSPTPPSRQVRGARRSRSAMP